MSSQATQKSIVIVGGGIVGSSIVYYLSLATSAARITLLEASSHSAPAASGKSGGFLALDWHGTSTASLARLSYNLHKYLAENERGAQKWGYREVDTWQVAIDTELNKSKGAKVGWLDQSIVKSMESMGGNGTTAQVTPGRLTEWLVHQAEKRGVQVRYNSHVDGLEFQDGKVSGVKVGGETIEATDIVLAAGPWTGSLIIQLFPRKLMPAHLKSASSIDGSRAHSVILSAAKPLSADCLFTEMSYGNKAGAPEFYCRSDGTVYVCGGSDEVPLPETADEVGYDQKKIDALLEQSGVLAPDSFDTERGAKVVAKQACYLPISNRTGNPIVGGKEGVYVAAGHSCWGINNSLGTGKVMAELILEGKVTSADIRALMP